MENNYVTREELAARGSYDWLLVAGRGLKS